MAKKSEKKKVKPLFSKGAIGMLKGMQRITKTDDKTGMKVYEAFPGERGVTFRIFKDDASFVESHVLYDRLAQSALKK